MQRPHRKARHKFNIKTLHVLFFPHQIFRRCFRSFLSKIINQNNENEKEEERSTFVEQRRMLLLLFEAASVCDDLLFKKVIKAVREKF